MKLRSHLEASPERMPPQQLERTSVTASYSAARSGMRDPYLLPTVVSLVRVALTRTAAASSLTLSALIPVPACSEAGCGRAAYARRTCMRMPRPVWQMEGQDERTAEVQRGEGGIGTDSGGQLLDALGARTSACVQRSGVWACGACARRTCTRILRPVWLTERRQMDERTGEIQRGEGGVDAERSCQLLDAFGFNTTLCVQRKGGCGHVAYVRRTCTRILRPVWLTERRRIGGGCGMSALERISVVRVVFTRIAAASSLTPSSPILLAACNEKGSVGMWRMPDAHARGSHTPHVADKRATDAG